MPGATLLVMGSNDALVGKIRPGAFSRLSQRADQWQRGGKVAADVGHQSNRSVGVQGPDPSISLLWRGIAGAQDSGSGLLAGRLLLGVVLERVGQVRLLRIAMLGTVAGALLFAVPSLPTAGAALPLLSFSLASIYPGLMSETPRRVGEALAPHAVGFQVSAAVLGVATVPGLAGALSERLGLAAVGWVIVTCALALLVLHERLVAVSDRRSA